MDSAIFEEIKSKLNLRNISKPMAIGLAVIVIMVAVAAGRLLTSTAAAKDFTVVSKETASNSTQSSKGPAGSSSSDYAEGEGGGSGGADGAGGSDDAGGGSGGVSGGYGGGSIHVHVVGAVNSPGLVELPVGSRVADAIDAAGSFTENASQSSVNLASHLTDGEQLIVLDKNEALAAGGAGAGGTVGSGGAGAAAGGTSKAGGTSSAAKGASSANFGKVNINIASAEELTKLPGVGPSTASKIVADRKANGKFKTKEDLKRVSGIGDKKYESLADSITV